MDQHKTITKNNNDYAQEQQLDRVKNAVNNLYRVMDETAKMRLIEIEKQEAPTNIDLIDFTLTVDSAVQNIINAFKKRVIKYND